MPLTVQEIQKLATLSRLKFEEEALSKFSSEFDNILHFIEKIGEADTEGVPPLTTTANVASTPERADSVTETNRREAYQQTAPQAEMGFYVVPKIVE